jgi:Cu-processing system ATP-binding protein
MMKKIRNSNGDLDVDLLQAFELEKIFDKQMRTLSGGTTQKVSATLAFLFNPEVLILDEPTAGLDPLASEILKEKIIKEREKGKLILITSHLLSELDDLISEIIFMQDGKVHFHKTIADLLESTNEQKISKAIAKILKSESNEQNH